MTHVASLSSTRFAYRYNSTAYCLAGTAVRTPTGWRQVEDLASGDVVLGFDLFTAEAAKCVVETVFLQPSDACIVLTTEVGEVAVSLDQPFWDPDAGTWRPASELKAGDALLHVEDGQSQRVAIRSAEVVRQRNLVVAVQVEEQNFLPSGLVAYAG